MPTRPGPHGPATPDSPRLAGLQLPRERARPARKIGGADSDPTMKIGEVAERVGLSMRSLRYYEEAGLITPAGRTSGGFRLYSELDVQRLLLVMQMKPLDYTLEQMRQVLDDLDALGGRGPGGQGGQGGPGGQGGAKDTGGAHGPANVAVARERLVALQADVEERYTVAQRRLEIASIFREHLATELGEAEEPAEPHEADPTD